MNGSRWERLYDSLGVMARGDKVLRYSVARPPRWEVYGDILGMIRSILLIYNSTIYETNQITHGRKDFPPHLWS